MIMISCLSKYTKVKTRPNHKKVSQVRHQRDTERFFPSEYGWDTAEQATKDGVSLPFNQEVARSSGSNDDETGILAVVVDVQVTPGDEKSFIEASL